MARAVTITFALMCIVVLRLTEARAADEEGPQSELMYPAKVQRQDYISGSKDSFVISSRMAVTDDFDTVVKFYSDKLGRVLDPEKNRIRWAGKRSLVSIATNDSHLVKPDDPFLNFSETDTRGVKLKSFVKDSLHEHVTLVISQVAGEGCTHILLTHIKRSDRHLKN